MIQKNIPVSIWSPSRRPRPDVVVQSEKFFTSLPTSVESAGPDSPTIGDPRSEFQHDYDRLLFSTPVRRLADKTQVWPMDENDSVRTRLTHSHEVANLARSIGTRVYLLKREEFERSIIKPEALLNVIQPVLLATGLGHDLGNPPFGHQGETAIGKWFAQRSEWIFTKTCAGGPDLDESQKVPEECRLEFTQFDGNPQALRLLTKLQTHIDGVGLDFTACTLAAGLKYPVSFENINKKTAIRKKGGYFSSEKHVIDWIRENTGLEEGQRHPLTWIMEACDDIAYSVLDVDDVLKKNVMSPDDILVVLRNKIEDSAVLDKINKRFDVVEKKSLRPETQREIKIQYLRASFLEALIIHASESFVASLKAIFSFTHEKPLMDDSELCEALKKIARKYAFKNPLVLKTEAFGAAALDGLMCAFWAAITEREDAERIESEKLSPRSRYIFSLISPNYIDQAIAPDQPSSSANGQRYRELRLLTDMISGMTDTFAMRLWKEIQFLPNANCS